LRPKAGSNTAHFYTLVSEDPREREFAVKRQLFLTEQGYRYRIVSGMNGLNGQSGNGEIAAPPASPSVLRG